jgi:hypothetical protein
VIRGFVLVLLVPFAASAQWTNADASVNACVRSSDDFVRTGLGEDMLFEKVTISGTSSAADSLVVLQGRIRMAPANVGNAHFYWDTSNGFNLNNQLNMGDGVFIAVDNLAPKRTAESVSIYGAHGVTVAPQAAVDACAGAREGQLTTLTTDGRLYQCDGATNHRLAGSISGTASLDFPNLAAQAVSSALTVTVTGATANEGGLRCNAAGSLGDNLQIWEAWVSASNTVSIRLKNDHATNAEDLAATTFSCTIVR